MVLLCWRGMRPIEGEVEQCGGRSGCGKEEVWRRRAWRGPGQCPSRWWNGELGVNVVGLALEDAGSWLIRAGLGVADGGTGEWVNAVPGGGLMSSMGAERDGLGTVRWVDLGSGSEGVDDGDDFVRLRW
ncbi:hypothetical protein M0R45_005305 [Rubus argutus]|uniref:Uncharacterized protein n=1 Tax=Rubus argutus TaxID=59490 RepID=A0AAW1YMD1_RUBAR